MRRLLGHTLFLLSLSLTAAACARASAYIPAGPTASLAPWPSATVTRVPPTRLPTVAAAIEIVATPTPFKHVVEQGETLLGIAFLYGIEEDALLLANPGIIPGLLSIGQELLIPGPGGTPIGSLIPSSTPLPLTMQPPMCYRRISGGVWCIAAVHNPTSQDLENLKIEIRMLDASGAVVQSTQVFPPLNHLPAGGTMPVVAAFPDGEMEEGSVSALVLSVIPAREMEGRYFTPVVDQTVDERQEGGLSWLVGGTVAAAPGVPESNRTLLLATAYDDADQVAGYAVWEATPVLKPGEARQFAVRVFSLGPEIARVELLAESYALADAAE